MHTFRADLHIHSRFSRATSSKLNPTTLAAWARVKGLQVLGTGDITHSRWRAELKEQLVFDPASGLYRHARPEQLATALPGVSLPRYTEQSPDPLFMLQGEISSIYKRGGKVRKTHNLVFFPDFEAAERFSAKLALIGNLESDGRPIVGLDSRHLLEMVLDAAPGSFLVPAHIWTPWFSVFGSKSGFDSLEECFGDLSGEIFAVETGLSSDPDMNRLVSHLDTVRLISNSDAHSGENLGREANLFSGTASYEGIYRALKETHPECQFNGTMEFFPEEGKYHLDGHRDCKVVLQPEESRLLHGLCPVCGKPLTLGVLYRVQQLADRDVPVFPEDEKSVSLIPLPELLSEIVGTGPKSGKVATLYNQVVARFGSELDILHTSPLGALRNWNSLLGEAIERMRSGQVIRQGGFDGEYGVVRVFAEDERKALKHGGTFAMPQSSLEKSPKPVSSAPQRISAQKPQSIAATQAIALSPAQAQAVDAGPEPVLVLAGPGSGKTRTLVERIAHLLRQGVPAQHILAVSFTRRAAKELQERLGESLGAAVPLPQAETLHALAFAWLESAHTPVPMLLDEAGATRTFMAANPQTAKSELLEAWQQLNLQREQRATADNAGQRLLDNYTALKRCNNQVDYTDLLEMWLKALTQEPQSRWTHILVDEVQDLSALQLALLQALLPENGQGFFGIGDPDQSIYAFRGAQASVHLCLQAIWPGLQQHTLNTNYRSSPEIVQTATEFMQAHSATGPLEAHGWLAGHIECMSCPDALQEARWIGGRIQRLLGGSSLSLHGRDALPGAGQTSPGDIAVLVRIKALIPLIQRTLDAMGVRCAAPENEVFWKESRTALFVEAARNALAPNTGNPDTSLTINPDAGPEQYTALGNTAPFDELYWQSAPFKALCAHYAQHGHWAGLLNWISLQNEMDAVKNRAEQVQILTLHAAKGLEFDSVFLPGLEYGIVPFAGKSLFAGQGLPAVENMEEERRLFYVGLTRAKRALFLSYATSRQLYGTSLHGEPSPFVRCLLPEFVQNRTLVAHRSSSAEQLPLF